MADLKSPTVIVLKGFLFLFLGFLAAGLLVVELPRFKTVALLGVTVWAFCRFYYFAFYVVEKYVARNYRFAGLGSFALYLLRSGKAARSVQNVAVRPDQDRDQST